MRSLARRFGRLHGKCILAGGSGAGGASGSGRRARRAAGPDALQVVEAGHV